MARHEPEFRVRLPRELLDWLKAKAASERRSMTQEVILRLERERNTESRANGAPAAGERLEA
jgi:hypothetical protein